MKVTDFIPQREPFLFVDEIVEHNQTQVHAQYTVKASADFFKGHFPGNPIMPGVLTCEAAFQTGALLMGLRAGDKGLNGQTAVVTRVQSAKFKNMAKPGDILDIKVDLVEELANAAFMKGKITNDGKVVLQIEFACAIVDA